MDVGSEFINNFLISTQKDVVSAVCLVGGDEVAVQGSWHGDDGLELLLELTDQVRLEDSGALAGLIQVVLRDVPARHDELAGINHGKNIFNRLVHVLKLTIGLIELETHVAGGALSEGTIEVGLHLAILGLP